MLLLLALSTTAGAQDVPEPAPQTATVVLTPPTLLSAPMLGWPEGQPYEPVDVALGLLIDEQGAVEDVVLLSGPEPFGALALTAATELVFQPAYEGQPAVAVEVPFTWSFEPPPITVRGQVRVAGTRDAAQNVTILLDGRETQTGADGGFTFRDVPPGAHTLEVIDAALRHEVIEFERVGDEVTQVDIIARPESDANTAMGVYYRSRSEVVSRALTADELRTTPGTMGDPVRAVANLPGVVRTPFDSGWMLVRGGDLEDTGVFIDGVRVPLIYHLGGFTSVLHPAMVDSVTFMPGGTSVRYGRSTAGAVDLGTTQVEAERRVELGADLLHSGVYAQTPLGEDNAIALAVRRSYLDKVLGLVLTEDQARIAPRFFDWQAKWDSDRFGLFVLGYKDTISAPTGNDDEVVEIDIVTNRVHGRADLETPVGHLQIIPVIALDERVFDYSTEYQQFADDGGSIRAELTAPESSPVAWLAGVDGVAGRYTIAVEQIERSSRYASLDPYASVRIGDERNLTLGMRVDTLHVPGHLLRAGLSPRAQASWKLGRSAALVADLGLVHQPPPFDMLVGLPDGRYLELEEAAQVGGGARLRGRHVGIELDAYYRHMTRVTLVEDDGTVTQGQGRAYGVESLTRWDWRDVSGWVAYTWSHSERQQEPGDLYRPHTYEQPHYLVVVGAWSLPRQLTLAGRWRVGSGYPQLGDTAYDLLQTDSLEVPLDTNARRLPPYHALDIKLSKKTTFRAWQLEGYLDVQNVYNRRVPEPLITGIDDSETIYGFGLITLPIFGVKGVFWPQRGAPPP
ncbi:MAG: TonB-dependent receptor plug domain-containing protein [Proteobacteria bacterium]|nr:TonB-dependent receptor plug domain-containing protein [Pseudomonadota bacterium]MCP4921375.1 TonB-dependent receptor plug domain-containing protein [Pseudomonadota bacterium]